jgi:hypothetical protein
LPFAAKNGVRAILVLFAISTSEFAPAFADALGQAPDDGIGIWRVVASFVFCVLLGAAAILILRARSGGLPAISFTGSKARRLVSVETLRLGPKSALSIVACDGKELLLLTSDNHTSYLGEPAGLHLKSSMGPTP